MKAAITLIGCSYTQEVVDCPDNNYPARFANIGGLIICNLSTFVRYENYSRSIISIYGISQLHIRPPNHIVPRIIRAHSHSENVAPWRLSKAMISQFDSNRCESALLVFSVRQYSLFKMSVLIDISTRIYKL